MRPALTPRVGIPAYFDPEVDGADWQQLGRFAPAVGLVVANPNSGPGEQDAERYRTALASTRSRGIAVVGYVSTAYGTRSLQLVRADIERWYAWYLIDGIFLDEAANSGAGLPFYRSLADEIRTRQPTALIGLNPGTQTREDYLQVCDVLVNFEGSWATYAADYPPNPAWVAGYPASRFWHIVYACPTPASVPDTLALARARNAGWMYSTDASGVNPYSRLPADAYWTAQVQRPG